MSKANTVVSVGSTSAANTVEPFVTVDVTPSPLYMGDDLLIKLYSHDAYDLLSPYNGLGSKSVESALTPLVHTEVVNISGNAEIKPKYPIASLISVTSTSTLVDSTEHKIILSKGKLLGGIVTFADDRLYVHKDLKLLGLVQIVYTTFPAQKWSHSYFDELGEKVLYAHNQVVDTYTDVPIQINDNRSNLSGIKFEPYPVEVHGYTPYASFVVFPASLNPLLKANHGTIHGGTEIVHKVPNEKVSFKGLEASASFHIDELISVSGFFFDASMNEIDPTIIAINGKLVANVECYGDAYIDYNTHGLKYDYHAEVLIEDTNPGTRVSVNIGTVYASDRLKPGYTASYPIPKWNDGARGAPVEFCKIYREVVLQEKNCFEKPLAWPTNNTYTGLNPPAGHAPVVGDATVLERRVHVVGEVYDNDTVDTTTHNPPLELPVAGSDYSVFADLRYMIEVNIPTGAHPYAEQSMNETIKRLKEHYGIA